MGSAICCLTNPAEESADIFYQLSKKPSLVTKLDKDNYNTQYEEFNLLQLTTILKNIQAKIPELPPTFESALGSIDLTQSNGRFFSQLFDLPNNSACPVLIFDQQIASLGSNYFKKGWNVQIIRYSHRSYHQYLFQLSSKYLPPINQSKIPPEILDTSDSLSKLVGIPILYRVVPFMSESCVICDDADAQQSIIPCGHVCLCNNCYLQHAKNLKNCPLCCSEIWKVQNYRDYGFRQRKPNQV